MVLVSNVNKYLCICQQTNVEPLLTTCNALEQFLLYSHLFQYLCTPEFLQFIKLGYIATVEGVQQISEPCFVCGLEGLQDGMS